jgi:hypothetical protein
MNVAIVEAGKNGLSRRIDYLCGRPTERLNLVIGSNGENASISDCQRLRFGELRIDCENIRIADNCLSLPVARIHDGRLSISPFCFKF